MKKRQSLIAVGYISAGNSIHQYLSFQFTLLLRKTINTQTMAFNGKWETESQDGYEEFCKLIGIPDDVISKGRDFKLVTEVIQNGDDYTWIQYYPNNHVVTNKFIVGKESDMETVGGKKFKGVVSMEGSKLAISFPKYHHTSEISGGKLVETSTATSAKGPVVFVRTSKKI